MSTDKKKHLQGLRGFAVISVVLFHFFPDFSPNGYLGVDQFFLLSGYLMTMMLSRHATLDSMKVLDFLYRRVKRIVPMYYLATFVILLSIFLSPISAWNTNFWSGVWAILFSTNLVRPLGMEGYAEKLGIGADMFTHTWSLALEMQFYLLFPIIFLCSQFFFHQRQPYFICLLGLLSLAFATVSDNFISFNCVFSRVWQFLSGMIVYRPKNVENNDSAEKLLEEEDEEENKDLEKLEKLITILCMISLTVLVLCPHDIDPFFGRINTTLLTSLIVYLGEGSAVLENRLLVTFGEVSYCWYLVHWPIVAQLKMNTNKCFTELCYGLIGSYFVSLLLHKFFEKVYLTWERLGIFLLIILLAVSNAAVLFAIYAKMPKIPLSNIQIADNPKGSLVDSPYYFDSDNVGKITMGYENATNEERARLNEAYDSNDTGQLFSHPCKKIPTHNKAETRCQVGEENHNVMGNISLLVIGNSYSQNIMGVVNKECKDVFSDMHLSAIAACEPLLRSRIPGYDCTYDWMFLDAAKTYQPDVMFIFMRHQNSMLIVNGTNPFDDTHFHTAVKRLQDLQTFVKKKIFILDVFPEVTTSITRVLNAFLRHGSKFQDTSLTDMSQHYIVAKERMFRLATACSKCVLFDYVTQFFIDGQFKVYDPAYHVSYFTKGQHLSPAGLERVRPLIRHLCHSL